MKGQFLATACLPSPQLFHLKKDRTEQCDVATGHPDLVFQLQGIFAEAEEVMGVLLIVGVKDELNI